MERGEGEGMGKGTLGNSALIVGDRRPWFGENSELSVNA